MDEYEYPRLHHHRQGIRSPEKKGSDCEKKRKIQSNECANGETNENTAAEVVDVRVESVNGCNHSRSLMINVVILFHILELFDSYNRVSR